jgi:hypothetical protein
MVREERQRVIREGEVKGRRGVHRRRRICPEMLADVRISVERLRRFG